jgi:hypothetical protein
MHCLAYYNISQAALVKNSIKDLSSQNNKSGLFKNMTT